MQTGQYFTRSRRNLPEKSQAIESSEETPTIAMADKTTGEKHTYDLILERLERLTNIEKNVEKIPQIEEKLDRISFEIQEVCDKQQGLEKSMQGMELEMNETKEQLKDLTHENIMLRKKLADQTEKSIRLESHSRRNNLLFGNLSESTPEDCEANVKNFIANVLGLSADFHFERVHRLGANTIKGKIRPIIACFSFCKERQQVWLQRKKLQKTTHWIAEDFPEEVQLRRRSLKPVLQQAVKLGKTAFLAVDKLVIDKTTYTVNNLSSLPNELSPAKLATPQLNENIVAFTGSASPLSNFHSSPFNLHGMKFLHNEQYYQHMKAIRNKAEDIALQILQESNPAKCKQMGGRVKVLDSDRWEVECVDIMREGCKAKFQQNHQLCQFLLATGKGTLVEARNDPFWGAGKWITDLQKDPQWPGSNELGKVLEVIRDELK